MKDKCFWSSWHRFTKNWMKQKFFCYETNCHTDEETLVDMFYLVISKALTAFPLEN